MTVLLFVGEALLAGCSPEDGYRKYAGAVGPDLYSTQTIRNTNLLDTYLGTLCVQAGLVESVSAQSRCFISNSGDWKILVDMGLYDIDQRCDTFLDRLYYKDKSEEPILAQLSNTHTFTRSVLEATKSSSIALQIVAAAFDITESSFRNVRGTLLEALDPTTVKSIVFKRQQEIKQQIYGTSITTRPEALHAMRAYLRVCMPFTIEMEANAMLTTAQRTGEAGDSPIVFNAEQFREELKSAPETKADQGTGAAPEQTKTANDLGKFEEDMTPSVQRRFAAAICARGVASTTQDFGAAGSPIRESIKAWETAISDYETGIKIDGSIDTPGEDKLLLKTIRPSNSYRCDAPDPRVRTTYEVAVLESEGQRAVWQGLILSYLGGIEGQEFGRDCKAAEARQAFLSALGSSAIPDGAFGPATRQALLAAKTCMLKHNPSLDIKPNDEFEPRLPEELQ